MKPWTRWLYAIVGLVAVFVAVGSVVQSIRQASWTPVESVGWLPAVIVAVWPGTYRRRCLPGRRRAAG